MPDSAPRLIADENFPLPSVRKLRENGVDVLSVLESCPGASDAAIMRLACDDLRWIVTYDRDYGELAFKHDVPTPPAILYFRQDGFQATHAADVLLQLFARAEEIRGHLAVVGEQSLRLRKLPGR